MRKLEQAWKAYEKAVYAAAEAEFERVVKPWLVKKGYDFITGMGGWAVHYRKVEHRVPAAQTLLDEDEIPQRVRRALEQEVEGFNQDLGSLMPSHLINNFIYDKDGSMLDAS